jgi:hypothetical protein
MARDFWEEYRHEAPRSWGELPDLAFFSGFGMSALVTAPLAQALIETYGILRTFAILGFAFLILLVLLSLILKFPPADWRLQGWQDAAAAASERSYTVSEMLETSSCLGLWLCFIIGSLSGLMAIGISSNVAQEIIFHLAPSETPTLKRYPESIRPATPGECLGIVSTARMPARPDGTRVPWHRPRRGGSG